MDIPTIITFLKSIYDDAVTHNLTRLQHEALREAIARLSEFAREDTEDISDFPPSRSKVSRGRSMLRLVNGQRDVPPRER